MCYSQVMSTRRNSRPHRCPRCKIHEQLCFCEHIKPFKIQSTVSLVVHVRELKLPSNTAQFVQAMLPENTHFDVRGRINEPLDLAPVVARAGRTLFLYPNETAVELTPEFKTANPGPYNLIVPDGNWTQARKVYQREVQLKGVQTVKLPAGIVGEYQLRKAPQPGFVSTYEAIAHALGVLEGEVVRDRMMELFRIFVKSVMHSRNNFHDTLELDDE
jgi:DTW domain-containing protein YfiP